MKKILLLIVVIFLCGCSNKLICTYKEDYEDIQIRNKIEFNFKDNTYTQIDKMVFSDEISAASYFNDISDYIEEYNLELVDETIVSEIKDEIKSDATKEDLKTQYESYNYVCK